MAYLFENPINLPRSALLQTIENSFGTRSPGWIGNVTLLEQQRELVP